MHTWSWILLAIAVALVALTIHDLLQRRHAIIRNFPIIGHFRYMLEKVGPELRQYIVTANDQERPFTRDQRRWVYASSKQQNNYFGFGTDNDLENAAGTIIIRQAAFPEPEPAPGQVGSVPMFEVPCGKVVGAWRGREHAFRPQSAVNVSGMSFGALSGPAVEAMNRGAKLAGCLHNTGEGGLTDFHQHGGELVFQVGTGYFGVRDATGRFDLDKLVALAQEHPIRAVEIKLSQGAKPGHGGVLPGAKVTPQIARFRGVEAGVDCLSPPGHAEFSSVPELVEFIERIADATGLPVGIKSAVGDIGFFEQLAAHMAAEQAGPDFITIDGGEGGTGAAPLVFADHVSLPFKLGMSRVYRAFAERDMHQHVCFAGSGRLGFPEQAFAAFALGCDWINVAREAMLAVGCIQAQRCHTNECPTGVATQSKWLMRGLDPTLKSARLANYIVTLRKELLELSRTCGVPHPSLVRPQQIEILDAQFHSEPVHSLFGYEDEWAVPHAEEVESLLALVGTPRVAPEDAGNVRPDMTLTRPDQS